MSEAPERIDPATLTDDQVADLSEEQADQVLREMTQAVKQQEEAPLEPPPEPPAEEPEAPAAEQPTEAQPAEAQEVQAEEPAPTEVPAEAEPEFDVQESYQKELELLTRRAEMAEKRRDILAGTYGSQIQNLREIISGLQRPQAAQQPQEDFSEALPQSGVDPMLLSRLQQIEEQQKARAISEREAAIKRSYETFESRVRGELSKDLATGEGESTDEAAERAMNEWRNFIAPKVSEQINQYSSVSDLLSPEKAGDLVRMILDSAHSDFQVERIRSARQKALSRKAEQVPKHRQMRQAAQISGAGSTGGSAPKTKPVEEWSAEEADRWLVQQFGDGHRRDRRRA